MEWKWQRLLGGSNSAGERGGGSWRGCVCVSVCVCRGGDTGSCGIGMMTLGDDWGTHTAGIGPCVI